MLRAVLIASLLVSSSNAHEPAISSLSPSTVIAGDIAFWLTVNGSGFDRGSVVRVDGHERTTTLLSPTRLAAMIAASDIVRVGTRQISVISPTGDISASLPLTIAAPPPPPKLMSISPSSIAAGSAFTLTVTGSEFTSSSLIEIDGETRATFAKAQTLATEISADELKTPGKHRVRVVTPAPGGGASEYLELRVTPGPQKF